MHRPSVALLVCCVAPALAQAPGELFERLASKDEAEAQAAHAALVAQGEALVPELERRLEKKPPERIAARLRAVLSAIHSGGLDALLTPRFELPDSAKLPAALSPDGTRVLYAAREIDPASLERSFEYRVATVGDDGLKLETVLRCAPGTRDDYLVPALRPGCWSPDGRLVGYTDGGAEGSRELIAGYVDVESGKATTLGSAPGVAHFAVRFDPRGERVAWIVVDPTTLSGAVQVRELKSGATSTLALPEGGCPIDLSYLEDGRALVLVMRLPDANLQGNGRQRPQAQVCLVSADGKTHTAVEQAVTPDDYFWDGPPVLLRTPQGERAFLEARDPSLGQKRPSLLWSFVPAKGEAKVLLSGCTWTPVGVIDGRRLSVIAHDGSSAGVLDVGSGEVTPLPHTRVLLDRRGERAVLLDLETRRLWVN
ncbi:MAG: hypothetical protein R3F62_21295 [Planctomycetota bacterium]